MATSTPMRVADAPGRSTAPLLAEPEVRLALAHGAVVLALLAAAALQASAPVAAATSLAVVCLVASGLPAWAACWLGVSQWALVTGFFINTLGLLTVDRADLLRLASVVALTVAATRLGALRRVGAPSVGVQ